MKYISKQELLEKLEEYYGDLDDAGGCYAGNGEWLSVERIVEIIEDLTDYED